LSLAINQEIVSTEYGPISILDLGRFLFGSSAAIIKLSESKSTLWLGLIFVLSAGFAREYDGEFLLAEPGYVFTAL
jgi:hypothetical protein